MVVPKRAVTRLFTRKTKGVGPVAWFRAFGYTDAWIKKHLVQGGRLGPYDYAPKSDEGWLFLIKHRLGLSFDSLDSALEALELPFIFAGREQFVLNSNGEYSYFRLPPKHLRDVGMQSPLASGKSLFLGRLLNDKYDHVADLAAWNALVPSWAPRVRAALAAQGLPFSVELLADGLINLDGVSPLFPEGEAPLSLMDFGVLQAGENGYLRSLSAVTLLLELWPVLLAFRRREINGPLTFGGGNSPLRSLPSYAAYTAAL